MLHISSIEKVVRLAACFLLFTFVSTAAFAQDSEDEAKMQQLVEQAATAFSEKRFAESAELFERAYEAKPNPTLLKNAMVAWYKAKRCDSAVHAGANFYREAQEGGQLEPKDQSEIQTVISCSLNLAQQRIDEQKFSDAEDLLFTATSAGPTAEQTERIATLRETLRKKREAASNASGTGGTTNPGDGVTKDDGEPTSVVALAGWGVTGVGVIGLIGSAVYGLTAASEQRAALSTCNDEFESSGQPISDDNGATGAYQQCVQDEFGEAGVAYATIADDVNSARTNSIIFYSLSGVVTAAGVGILVYHYFFSPAEEAAPSVMITPVIGTDGAGAQLQWRF